MIESNNGSFFGLLTKDSVYQCDPPQYAVCDQGVSDYFYGLMITAILNCITNNEQNTRSSTVGESFFHWAVLKYPDKNQEVLRSIAGKYDVIADILCNRQAAGNEWKQYGDYFTAAFQAAQKANNIDNGDYLNRLNQFITIFESKLDQLNRMESDRIALFVGTFTDTELMYLPMPLRIKTLDMLSQSPELKNLLDPQKRKSTELNWAMRENMILKLIEQIEPGLTEKRELLAQLKTSNTIKRINNQLDDFITLVDDNYTRFLDIIDDYVYHVNTINANTRGNWLQKLYDEDKTFNISKITQQGEAYIAATGITSNGEIKLQFKEFNGKYTTETVNFRGDPCDIQKPLYDNRDINISYDQPITIYHNAYLSGVSTDHSGTMQIASALRAHYYLQKHKDEVTASAAWAAIDLATLFVGAGEISAALKAASKWRLVLGVCNTASSAGSLLATGLEKDVIDAYGPEGKKFITSMRKVSAVLGVADLGAAGVRKFGNMLDKDLIIIGKFHGEHGLQMSQAAQTEVKELERTTKRLVDNFDDELKAAIKNASQGTDVLASIRATYPKLYDKIAYIQESLKKEFLTDFAEDVEALKRFNSNTNLVDAWDMVHSYSTLRKDKQILEAAEKLLTNSKLSQSGLNANVLTKLIEGNRGAGAEELKQLLKGYDELVASSVKFENIDKLIADLDKGDNFAVGARWIQKYLVGNTSEFKAMTVTFEEALKAGENVRRVDMVVKKADNAKRIFYEFKSVQSVPPQYFAEQFIKDLSLPEIEDLDQIKWIFDGNKVSSLDKVDFLNMLKKEDLFTSKRLFEKYYKTTFDSKEELYNYLRDNNNWFNLIFKIK